jgi:hypothetical protein
MAFFPFKNKILEFTAKQELTDITHIHYDDSAM